MELVKRISTELFNSRQKRQLQPLSAVAEAALVLLLPLKRSQSYLGTKAGRKGQDPCFRKAGAHGASMAGALGGVEGTSCACLGDESLQ